MFKRVETQTPRNTYHGQATLARAFHSSTTLAPPTSEHPQQPSITRFPEAPPLQMNLDRAMIHELGRCCERYGRRSITQAGLKRLQAIPIAHAALSVKEAAKMLAAARNLAMSNCYQEIPAPG